MTCTDPNNCTCPGIIGDSKIYQGIPYYLIDKHMNVWSNVAPDMRPYEG